MCSNPIIQEDKAKRKKNESDYTRESESFSMNLGPYETLDRTHCWKALSVIIISQ